MILSGWPLGTSGRSTSWNEPSPFVDGMVKIRVPAEFEPTEKLLDRF